jgi:hypothetical protein
MLSERTFHKRGARYPRLVHGHIVCQTAANPLIPAEQLVSSGYAKHFAQCVSR